MLHDFSYLMKTNLSLLDDCQDFLRLTQKRLGKQSPFLSLSLSLLCFVGGG